MPEINLFDITFPVVGPGDGDIQELYCRINNGFIDSSGEERQSAILQAGGSVSFDTFFNLFSYRAYAKYTAVETVNVEVSVKGKAAVYLRRHYTWPHIAGGQYKTETLACQMVDSIVSQKVQLTKNIDEPAEEDNLDLFDIFQRMDGTSERVFGFYYVEVVALEDNVQVFGGRYYASVPEVQPVRLAIGICTFKREKEVEQNVAVLRESLAGHSALSAPVEFFIADNGGTVGTMFDGIDFIHVFPNKNYGGSGGFSRVLLEAGCGGSAFSHILLLDDDIYLDPKAVLKTISLLNVLKPEYRSAFIGGATFHSTSPLFQYEKGSIFDTTAHGLNRRYMVSTTALLENERLKKANFCAWTYTCLPARVVQEHGLPLPFFIKGDDIEYALRCAKDIVLMNGIGVWHEPYIAKYSPHLVYFDVRNKMVIRALHRDVDVGWEIEQLEARILRLLDMHLYDVAEYAIMAGEDFLKGVVFFLNNEEDKQLEALLAMRESFFETKEQLEEKGAIVRPEQIDKPIQQDTGLLHLLNKLSYNGNTLPMLLLRRSTRTLSYDDYQLYGFPRAGSCILWSKKRNKGILTTPDPKRFYKLWRRTRKLLRRMRAEYSDVVAGYRNRVSDITSVEFWSRHLGI